jgi:lipoate-protein ligase B
VTRATVVRIDLGRSDYSAALALQRELHAKRVAGKVGNLLLLTEHEPVLTLGRRGNRANLLASSSEFADRGLRIVETERGGDVTYHGPGQLVAYPILALQDFDRGVRGHVWRLEESTIRLLERCGVDATRRPGAPGVWVGPQKIASVGVYVSRGVSMHGIAVNISPSLEAFDFIHPCGLIGVQMTSVAVIRGTTPSMPDAIDAYAGAFAEVFGVALAIQARTATGL